MGKEPEAPTAPGEKIEKFPSTKVPEKPGGYEGLTSLGKEFVTVFMQNHDPKETPQLELLVTGTKPSTSVSVTINKSDFRKDVKVGEGETVSIPITTNVEMSGSDTSPSSLVIKSDVEVTIVSRSYKYGSSDTALLYPVRLWGVEYYIITPPWGADGAHPEFSVITHENPTVVNIDLKGAVSFQGKNYPKDSKLTLTLEPFQAVQIQSTDDLSGTKVVADHPVAVISGHTCSQKNGDCGHVYEQLLPVPSWGYSFFVPGMSFQPKSDFVFIIPAKDTEINYQSGSEEKRKKLLAGEVLQLEVTASSPLNINADSKLQVLFFGTGGTFNTKPFDPFLTNVPATERFAIAYELIGQDKFETNLAVFVIKTSDKPGITVDGKLPKGVKWKEFPGSKYSWGEYNYGSGFSYHTVKHPTEPFGLLSIGYSPSVSYGSVAPSIRGPALTLVQVLGAERIKPPASLTGSCKKKIRIARSPKPVKNLRSQQHQERRLEVSEDFVSDIFCYLQQIIV
ncbi:IgGFc-binding protein-like [Bombina bombina]|uniref:IgGFc-binding protein-like n=1 Tax=Bombina bombina TaxID=8345 RepID=UPI00235A9B2F|nr:IgGFc-binding protein-like [Bombina bombina]